jgi:predicted NAD/FAD-dependent oxidoreductase
MTLNIAIIGAGIAGITAARTLAKAGHHVHVFEKSRGAGGRMSTRESNFGTFDHGAQYFTVRDPRFSLAIQAVPGTTDICRPWSANAVRVLDPLGHVFEAARATKEAHFVAKPGMNALVRHWAEPLGKAISYNTPVNRLERAAKGLWTVHTDTKKFPGFDHVLLAIPSVQAENLLKASGKEAANAKWLKAMDAVEVAPCWTMMVAFPNATQPNLHIGPQWNAARSIHHRIAWLTRESSKPGRGKVERWTVQASAAWSAEHIADTEARVTAKLLRAFSELTGIRAEPAHTQVHRWLYAKTITPLGAPYQYNPANGLGTCGDWHLGHRVEDAFVSGLELALAVCQSAKRL